ncbi:hypothetical protein [Enterocloster bolteae]|uniref:hypothetical protein n=1 Tax=Enterocloster bolteae TaxID=208479 RepID=UPI002A805018|nr:hypothetical protein [Enterocloster bolteae]
MDREQMINLVVAAVVSSTVLSAIVTHLLYARKLRKEQRIRSEGITGEKIVEALYKIRDIELRCCEMKILETEEWLSYGVGLDFFGGTLSYPTIMSSTESLDAFFDMINVARREEERYLGYKTASYLSYMENYILQLVQYLHKNNLDESYPLAGYVIQKDFIDWQIRTEKNVVNAINSPKYKLSIHTGIKWIIMQKIVKRELWNKSILNGLLNDSKDSKVKMAKAILSKDIDEVLRLSEQ